VLDLYAGCGVVSFELLSRGASAALQVELARPVVQLLQRNAKDLGISAKCQVLQQDVAKLTLSEGTPYGQFDVIYADPPFTEAYPDLRGFLKWLNPDGVAVFEMPTRKLPDWASEARDLRKYGESTLAFF
jgi:16S rRNA (guanine966-N2)-methyltransferase